MTCYRHLWAVFLVLAVSRGASTEVPIAQAAAPLRAYAGLWSVRREGSAPGAKREELRNDCNLIGRYFACQQTVNGTVGGLLVIVPSNTPGKYFTQDVAPTGRATGLGELQIEGNKWVLYSSWNQGAKTTRYRTTNTFSGRDRIHFEQEESEDGRNWKVTGSGDYTRVK